MRLFIRTIGLVRAKMKIGMGQPCPTISRVLSGIRDEVRPHDGEIAARDANRRFLKQEINKIDGSHRGEEPNTGVGRRYRDG